MPRVKSKSILRVVTLTALLLVVSLPFVRRALRTEDYGVASRRTSPPSHARNSEHLLEGSHSGSAPVGLLVQQCTNLARRRLARNHCDNMNATREDSPNKYAFIMVDDRHKVCIQKLHYVSLVKSNVVDFYYANVYSL